jgi:hypothetical protein
LPFIAIKGHGAEGSSRTARGLRPVGKLAGLIKFRNPDLTLNVYFLYALLSSRVDRGFDPRISAFGDTAVLFLDADELPARLSKAVQAGGHQLQHGLVRYIDDTSYGGAMNTFMKGSRFAYQSEALIVVSTGL